MSLFYTSEVTCEPFVSLLLLTSLSVRGCFDSSLRFCLRLRLRLRLRLPYHSWMLLCRQTRLVTYRAYKYPYTTSTEHEPKQQRTARAGALMAHHPAWVGHHTDGSRSTPIVHRCRYDERLWVAQQPQAHHNDKDESKPQTRLRDCGKHNRVMVAEQKIGTTWSNDGTKIARQRDACDVSQ